MKRLRIKKKLRVAGLMSGTSADGVDVAIVDIAAGNGAGGPDSLRVKTLAFDTVPYAPGVRRRIVDLFDVATARVDEICRMNFVIGELFADALIQLCRKNGIELGSIDLIGSHGQTIHHLPGSGAAVPPVSSSAGSARKHAEETHGRDAHATLQIGEPCVIAERTGVTTVADFRTRDMAAGGQGAPLVPLADYILFGHPTLSRATQNIGGIANVTYLPGGTPAPAGAGGGVAPRRDALAGIVAFDTGPGNMIIDRLAWRASGGKWTFDKDGRLANKGHVDGALLARLMRHAYLRRRPPKTTGRELFGIAFADAIWDKASEAGLSACDVIATATAFTAASIADAYRRFLPAMPDEVILCGGGARNPVLVAMLSRELAGAKVMAMDELGVNADTKEAISFAILAYRTIHGLPGNVPSATGAREAVVLGKIVPGRRNTGYGGTGRP
jgi:anhydro-N-acetylmuramic acid kinase